MKSLGWEGNWSCTTLVLIGVFFLVQFLFSVRFLEHALAINAIACGGVIAFMHFGEFGEGRVWYGGLLPAGIAWWGLQVFF